MHDPMMRQQISKETNQNNLQLRDKLQIEANQLEARFHRTKANGSRDEKLMVIGEIKMYAKIRQSLSPIVLEDMYGKSLMGLAIKLEKELKEETHS